MKTTYSPQSRRGRRKNKNLFYSGLNQNHFGFGFLCDLCDSAVRDEVFL